ncbi:glycosyltransferase family 2 protein [Blastococcus sp. URHD0036]|uniref:glycosyltransferase family 2 protein n=1 Tax=Blastococcus sp. URHD0036 TaxID=1380356 RepID=UPI0006897DDF|nr:glycosyltransferase family 2 protein [Blastococcus sp. URHD0036]
MNAVPQKVVVAIPAYNCAPQIGRVLDEIPDEVAARVQEIWVIDNRSTDDTLERALEYQRSGRLPNLRVFRNRQNNSLGGTHKVAFEHARAAGMTHVVILHGDNQAKSDELALLLDHAQAHPETQTVLGSRFSRHSQLAGYDAKRVWGNRVLNGVYSVVTLRSLQDLGSGLNLFALRDLDPATYLRFANQLTFNYELILDLVRRKVRFAYLPISWREEDQVSNARNWNIFRTALRNLALWRLGRPTSQPATDRDYEWDEVR